MRKFLMVLLGAFIFLAIEAHAPVTSGFGGVALAQEQRPRNLFDLLFPRRAQPNPQVQTAPPARSTRPAATPQKQAAPRRAASSAARSAARAAAPEPQPQVAEKFENARKVLVVGDFIADGMAQGLEEAFADVASVVIETRPNGSSGFVRDDFYNWPEEIGGIIDEVKPDIVVMLIGSNDRQVMRIDGKTEKVRSEAWDAEYKKRIEAFVKAVRDRNIILVWTGSPPFKFSTMSADILAFNEMYRNAVTSAGGYFVDIWDGFVDAEGRFVTSGSDIKGQPARLRASDGINFTKAGKRKMAFYVERQLKQILGDAASPLLTSLATDNLPMLQLPPLQTEADLDRTNPIAVTDPDFDGGAVLLGDINAETSSASNPLQAKSYRQRLVEDGIPPPARTGRAGSQPAPG